MRSIPPTATAEKKIREIPVMIISNTCDNSVENLRLLELNLIYAPIAKISELFDFYRSNGVEEKIIKSLFEAIKNQKVTHMFYLPVGFGITDESVVFFDKICSCENTYISDNLSSLRFCSLSNYGFYLLLFKLSVHFTRIRERVDRDKGIILE